MLEPFREQRLSEARVTTADPNITSPYALPIPTVTVETVKGGGLAKANFGFARSQTSYRFTFRSPIGDTPAAEANPLSLTGLGNNAAAEFAFTHVFLFKTYQDSDLLGFCSANGIAASSCSDQAFKDEAKRREFIGIALHQRPSMVSLSGEVGAPSFQYSGAHLAEPDLRKADVLEDSRGVSPSCFCLTICLQ